ncbi:MAG: hypothetical protein WA813_27140 [Beijerinckiaceae bacterium]
MLPLPSLDHWQAGAASPGSKPIETDGAGRVGSTRGAMSPWRFRVRLCGEPVLPARPAALAAPEVAMAVVLAFHASPIRPDRRKRAGLRGF